MVMACGNGNMLVDSYQAKMATQGEIIILQQIKGQAYCTTYSSQTIRRLLKHSVTVWHKVDRLACFLRSEPSLGRNRVLPYIDFFQQEDLARSINSIPSNKSIVHHCTFLLVLQRIYTHDSIAF